jgi:UDP-N-acetylmuramoyl-tripeptide--D-alanyl-D-alanine ligase
MLSEEVGVYSLKKGPKKNDVPSSSSLVNIHFVSRCHAVLNWNGKQYDLQNEELTGEHNFSNMALAFMMACLLKGSCEKLLLERVSSFRPKENRSSWIHIGKLTIFLDAYNANPSSMKASLKAFSEAVVDRCVNDHISKKDVLMILGDMNELGDIAEKSHQDIGHFLNEDRWEQAVFIGRWSPSYAKTFKGKSFVYDQVKDYLANQGLLDRDRYQMVFVKASRSLSLETIVDFWKKDYSKSHH